MTALTSSPLDDWDLVDLIPDAPPITFHFPATPPLRINRRRGTIPVWAWIEAKEHRPEPFTMHNSVWNSGLPQWVLTKAWSMAM